MVSSKMFVRQLIETKFKIPDLLFAHLDSNRKLTSTIVRRVELLFQVSKHICTTSATFSPVNVPSKITEIFGSV